jgi:iron complex outermembrane receptor protein
MDLGLRWRIRPGTSFVLAGFEIRKPLFDSDAAGVYRKVGRVVTRGLEASLVSNWPRDLTTVMGLVLYDPKSRRDSGLAAGDWPQGLPAYTVNLGLDYRPSQGPFSVDANVQAVGKRRIDTRNATATPANVRIDLGARYRFKVAGSDALARATVTNVLDTFAWNVNARGALYASDRRRASLSLTVDF